MYEKIQKYWRSPREHVAPHHRENASYPRSAEGIQLLPEIPATRFFDNLAYIGDECVGCFVLYTSEGPILLDSMWPSQSFYDLLEKGLKELGFNGGEDIRAVLVTHGHGDHWGAADYLYHKYATKVYMSEGDWMVAIDHTGPKHMFYPTMQLAGYLSDGQDWTLGDTTVHMVRTPGHTDDCMSFIFPVYDEGRKHYAGLWGGTGQPRKREAVEAYIASAHKFSEISEKYGVDVEITAHPFVDCTPEKLAIVRNISDGVANPFVIGRDACRRYEQIFVGLGEGQLAILDKEEKK